MIVLAHPVYLATGATDLRKSIDGLAMIVQYQFYLDPFSPCLFAFCNRKKDKMKVLVWDHNGFWLHYKRLEKGRFQWPEGNQYPIKVDQRQMQWLLDGLPMHQPLAHRAVMERQLL
jgi:transposase